MTGLFKIVDSVELCLFEKHQCSHRVIAKPQLVLFELFFVSSLMKLAALSIPLLRFRIQPFVVFLI